jgi:hypothetical protein
MASSFRRIPVNDLLRKLNALLPSLFEAAPILVAGLNAPPYGELEIGLSLS